MPEPGWAQLSRWIRERWGGELLPELDVGEAGHRHEDGSIASVPERIGHVFFGPYRALPDGKYRIVVRFNRDAVRRREIGRATLETAVDGAIIAQTRLDHVAWRAGAVELDFDIRSGGEPGCNSVLEVRLHSRGKLSLTIKSVYLALRDVASDLPAQLPARERRDTSPGSVPGANSVRELDVPRTEFSNVPPETPTVGALVRPLSRMVAFEDWNDPAWSRFLDAGASNDHRDLEQWSRTHVLYGLDRCDKLTLSARVLVAATMPDEIIGRLSEYVGQVDVLDLARQSSWIGSEARLYWTNGALYARDRVNVHDPAIGLHDLGEGAYDAIVFPHSSLLLVGTLGIARLLTDADRALATSGVIAFKAEILSGTEPNPAYLDESIFGQDGFLAHIEAYTGLAVVDAADGRVDDPATATAPGSGTLLENADLSGERGGRPAVPGVWFLRKRHDTPSGAWKRVEQWLLRRLLGEQIDRLELGAAGRRDAAGIAASGGARGTLFYGPYLALPEGRYEAVVTMTPASPKRGHLVLDVLASGRRLSSRKIDLRRDSQLTVALPFAVPPSPGDAVERIEFRAWHDEGDVTITSCRLNLVAEA